MAKPLNGILVVSMCQAVAAPYAASRLADAGARVIKVERPGGDFARHYDSLADGHSAHFVWLNRGKESIVLDIKQADDLALLHRMIAKADVWIQNLAPGAAARGGFGSDELRAKHPKLITCDISGYGEEGDYSQMKAYDLLVQAETGLTSVTGNPHGPGRVGVSVCDISAGMYAQMGILEALLERQQTGRGKGVKISLFDCIADWMSVPWMVQTFTGQPPPRLGLNHPNIAPYGAYETSDGGMVMLSIQSQREWREFCDQVVEQPDLADHPDYDINERRVANRDALDGVLRPLFGKLTRQQFIDKLAAARIAYGAVNSVADFAQHEQLRKKPVPTDSGPLDAIAAPIRFVGEDDPFQPVPALDEQGEAIRAEFAEGTNADD